MKKILISLLLILTLTLGFDSPALSAPVMAEEDVVTAAVLQAGLDYLFGTGGKSYDSQKAVEALQKAAVLGSADAYYYLSVIEGERLRPGREETVFKLCRKAAELGSPLGLYGMGECYFYGDCVPENDDRAKELYTQAVDAGGLIGWVGLGDFASYMDRADEARDCYEKALEGDWYTRCTALCALGQLYCYGGQGLDADVERGIEYYTQAAEAGFMRAFRRLGNLYYYGQDVEEDLGKALDYFSEEAARGSYYNLGWMYMDGSGVEADASRAVELFEKDVECGRNAYNSSLILAYMKANAMGTQKDTEGAAALLAPALAIDPDVEDYYLEIADMVGVAIGEERENDGLYVLSSIRSGADSQTPEEANLTGSLLLRRDGTGLLVLNGSTGDLPKWTETETTVTLFNGAGEDLECESKDHVITIPLDDETSMLFTPAEALGESTRLYACYSAIDAGSGAHLRYTLKSGFLDSTQSFDVHSKGGMYYSGRTTRAAGVEAHSATLFKDGTAYNLDLDDHTGIIATTVSMDMGSAVLLMDSFCSAMNSCAYRTDYSLEYRDLEGKVFLVECYPALADGVSYDFYFDASGQLCHLLQSPPASYPDLGESFYTLESIDGKVDESLFSTDGYTIE